MQKSKDLDASLSKIREALMRIEGESKTGAQIHQIILDAVPNLDIRAVVDIPAGPGALTKFIKIYLSQIVKRIGMKGGDILYGIGEGVVPPPETTSASIWKDFVSPSAVHHLCLRTSDMKLIDSETLDLDDGSYHIARVTPDEHATIQQAFRTNLTENQRELLDEKIEPTSSYDEFVSALRSIGLNKLWGKHRREAYKNLLIERLQQIPLHSKVIPAVVDQLMESQRALFVSEIHKPAQTKKLSSDKKPEYFSPGGNNLNSARFLARSVIDSMDYDELRALQFPFGAVLDALSALK